MKSVLFYTEWESPIGRLLLGSTLRGLSLIAFPGVPKQSVLTDRVKKFGETPIEDRPSNFDIIVQLQEYFNGNRTAFSLPLHLQGTDFQKNVWHAVAAVPFGETRSYGQIAREISNPKSVRAVGGANGANPIPIVVPCHRIIGTSGKLTGFGGGLPLKKALLDWEQEIRNHENPSLFDTAPLAHYWSSRRSGLAGSGR